MTDRTPPRDSVAVHRGLLAIARDRNADFNAILVQYAIERLLDRLSTSTEDRRFVLKGAMLFRVWTGELHRPTRDVDFLGHGEASPTAVADAIRRIVAVEGDDGLRFDPDSIAAEEIREEHVIRRFKTGHASVVSKLQIDQSTILPVKRSRTTAR